MKKRIVVVGGGISGLATLHYLKDKYKSRNDVDIVLLEKEESPGGTIHSHQENGFIFEWGPNGFLNNKQRTIQLAQELGLAAELIPANQSARIRYISLNNRLYPAPLTPLDFIRTNLFSIKGKLRILCEYFSKPGREAGESVHDFLERHFGEEVSRKIAGPFVSGIYAGDSRSINLRAAFPMLYDLDQRFGSIIKGLIHSRKRQGKKEKTMLYSFRQGMGQLINALWLKHREHIQCGREVTDIMVQGDHYALTAGNQQLKADEVFICAPAYAAATVLQNLSLQFREVLRSVLYAPVVVIGMIYPKTAEIPSGFGYLLAGDKPAILGLLFENQIFQHRSPNDCQLLRVMIGGIHHQDILSKTDDELLALARSEIENTLKYKEIPQRVFIKRWPRAIPQYTQAYFSIQENIRQELQKHNNLHLVANYRYGVSVNDCVQSACAAAQKSCL